mgnify:CR=1 FL=1|jgi:hypothetical protein
MIEILDINGDRISFSTESNLYTFLLSVFEFNKKLKFHFVNGKPLSIERNSEGDIFLDNIRNFLNSKLDLDQFEANDSSTELINHLREIRLKLNIREGDENLLRRVISLYCICLTNYQSNIPTDFNVVA